MEKQPVIVPSRFFITINKTPARVFLILGENEQYVCCLTATEHGDMINSFDALGFRVTRVNEEEYDFEPIPLWKNRPSKLTNELMLDIWNQILAKGIDNPD